MAKKIRQLSMNMINKKVTVLCNKYIYSKSNLRTEIIINITRQNYNHLEKKQKMRKIEKKKKDNNNNSYKKQ